MEQFEDWCAQGDDSTGTRHTESLPGKGGLGGYSKGILTLNKNKIIYVFVGSKSQTASSVDGDTISSHMKDSTSVPGTGGGSTSIRMLNESIYSRIIVAGGAGGDSYNKTKGGFGDGFNRGNVDYAVKETNQGSGTQTGSTCGRGCGKDGNAGNFGHGATTNYCPGRDTGGCGGGGWYGGGSGGYGENNACSGGGGGSGWVFKDSCFNEWVNGDSFHAGKFKLNKSYYLTKIECKDGNESFSNIEGNEKEKGHTGNDFVKITLE